MGVDFYVCHYCKDTFADCGPYERCENCGRHWCSSDYDNCAEREGLVKSEDSDEWGLYETSCNFCRNEAAEESDLLGFALSKLGVSREDLEKEYLALTNTKSVIG
jgi:hypothetical protein